MLMNKTRKVIAVIERDTKEIISVVDYHVNKSDFEDSLS